MKKIKTLLVSLLVILTIALAINFNTQNQVGEYDYVSKDDEQQIITLPLPYSYQQPTLSLSE